MTLKKCSQFASRTKGLVRLKQTFSLFPPRKLLVWAVYSLITQSHYCISNDVKAKLSRTFHGEMTLFASVFAKPMKIRAHLCSFDKPTKCFAFLLTSCFYVYFSRSYESHSNSISQCFPPQSRKGTICNERISLKCQPSPRLLLARLAGEARRRLTLQTMREFAEKVSAGTK